MRLVTVNYKGFTLQFLPEKALWIKELGLLLIADLHFGKATHFRKSGIPIPEAVHDLDFQTLSKLHAALTPSHTYFLGDLFHSSWNDQWDILVSFLSTFPHTHFHLVKGNHDILPPYLYSQSILEVHDKPLALAQFVLSHEPMEEVPEGVLNICGHLHPGIFLKGPAKQSLRIPCFHYREGRLILPSFGNFTGLALMGQEKNDLIWGVTEKKVIPILSASSIG
jgi:DNA ligase-associated metallophosphoesterase